jgi:hypothetical protein
MLTSIGPGRKAASTATHVPFLLAALLIMRHRLSVEGRKKKGAEDLRPACYRNISIEEAAHQCIAQMSYVCRCLVLLAWGELPRTPCLRSSQNNPSTHFGA